MAAALLAAACGSGGAPPAAAPAAGPFEDDRAFLTQHTDVVQLRDGSGGEVLVAPEYQGRVMTSTVGGPGAPSFGWVGRAAIASGARAPHINVFGGEDRFWLGPEGGQFALYFRPGDPFDLEHWQVPEPIDWGPWDVVSRDDARVSFRKAMSLENYSGARFELSVDRTVRMLTPSEIASHLGVTPGSVRGVAYESSNVVTNTGTAAWAPDTGLVSIWILGMFQPSPQTTIVIPFTPGTETEAGPVVNDRYFGAVPPDRLVVRDGVLFFRGDGQHRSKIGLSPSRARSLAGSYDAGGRVLTLVQYTRPADAQRYVNSMWEHQEHPYAGDVINSYNDGPPAPGQPPMGPFYELETSSPALALSPAEQYTHVHRTFHFVGAEADLDRLARATLGVSLADIRSAFAP